MQTEMEALEQNHTWDLISLPSGESTVGCKWLFTIKYLTNGSVDLCKALLVAKGFTQISGKDFGATFAPVAKLTSVRLSPFQYLILGLFTSLMSRMHFSMGIFLRRFTWLLHPIFGLRGSIRG